VNKFSEPFPGLWSCGQLNQVQSLLHWVTLAVAEAQFTVHLGDLGLVSAEVYMRHLTLRRTSSQNHSVVSKSHPTDEKVKR